MLFQTKIFVVKLMGPHALQRLDLQNISTFIFFQILITLKHSRISELFNDLLTFWLRNYFFLILAHLVYKMWITQEPNKLELWNKLHFEEKKTESLHHV